MQRSKLRAVAPTESLAFWLGKVCQGGRTTLGLRLEDIAKGRVDPGTLSRFERAGIERKSPHPIWRQHPEAIVACYAEAFGIDDARKLFEMALDAWLKQGRAPAPPVLEAEEPLLKTVDQLEQDIHAFVQRVAEDHPDPDRGTGEGPKKDQAAE